MIHSLRAFRHRNLRLFFCGQSLAVLRNWIQYLAMSWLVYRLTGSAWLWRLLPELRGHIRPIYVKLGIIAQ